MTTGGCKPRCDTSSTVAALKQHHRIFIEGVPNSSLKTIAAIKMPFPELVNLELVSSEENTCHPRCSGDFISRTELLGHSMELRLRVMA